MATVKNLKIKTGVCKRMMKELHSYQTEADRECVKTDNMKNSHADPFDIKQQEHVLAESCLMISNCRKRLETALTALEAAVVGHHHPFYFSLVEFVFKDSLSGLSFEILVTEIIHMSSRKHGRLKQKQKQQQKRVKSYQLPRS
ncbi:hypothetical protein KC19_10G062200 [Ceratodon purpureus]|uniref:Tubulin-specific chaperone A n=1 Tax=Ceratodon purpureus TaxID=3225 RepID=A0A8T0GK26_CERPU|nr:hypothetical protein KC19_10G062200 [Ceratodon purpureus]